MELATRKHPKQTQGKKLMHKGDKLSLGGESEIEVRFALGPTVAEIILVCKCIELVTHPTTDQALRLLNYRVT